MVRPNLPQQVEAVHVRHPEVDHRQVGGAARQRPHRLGAAPAGDDLEAGPGREAFDDLQHRRLVVDDEKQRARDDGLVDRHGHGSHPAAGARERGTLWGLGSGARQ